MSDREPTDLCPALQAIYAQWLAQCKVAGLTVRAIVTWRDAADQDAAKAEGLSNAGAGASPHNCVDDDGNPASRAFDFGVFTAGGAYVEDGTDPRYREVGDIGKTLGLEWGGDWHHADWDHLELADWRNAQTG